MAETWFRYVNVCVDSVVRAGRRRFPFLSNKHSSQPPDRSLSRHIHITHICMLKQTNLVATSRTRISLSRRDHFPLRAPSDYRVDKDGRRGCLPVRLLTTLTARGRICLRAAERRCLVSPSDRNSTAALHKFTSQPQPGLRAAVWGELLPVHCTHTYFTMIAFPTLRFYRFNLIPFRFRTQLRLNWTEKKQKMHNIVAQLNL